jgi:hypothetical protein
VSARRKLIKVRRTNVPIEAESPREASRPRRWPIGRVALVCVLAGLVVCVWSFRAGRAFTSASAPAEPVAQEQDFSKFSHSSPKHASLGCASCHQRNGSSVEPTYDGKASLPGHKACTDCHLPQFVQQNTPMCYICHTNVENNGHPPVKPFPGLLSFNAKFDHAQHNTGSARPTAGCAACHAPAGRRSGVLTIPARLNAHAECYSCHTPDAQANGRNIGSCSTCHALGRYARTPATGRSFAAGFNHATHGARQGLNCASCHNVRPGAPQRQQVTSTRPLQHFGSGAAQTCMTCHNGRRTFGDENFADCAKCHKGATFRM